MKKMIGMLFLGGAFALAAVSSDVSAQDKKKVAPKTSASGAVIELVESKDGKYRFTIRDADGKYIAGSAVGHATEAEAKAVVEELKTLIGGAKYVSKKSDASKEKAKDKAGEKDSK